MYINKLCVMACILEIIINKKSMHIVCVIKTYTPKSRYYRYYY